METQTDHWPSLLNCIIAQMTDNLSSMNIKEIYQGILLASKLLSRISPDMKSPTISRKKVVNDRLAYGGIEIGNNDDREEGITLQGRTNEVNNMQLCVQQSTQFFNAFVVHWVLGCLKENSRTNTGDGTRGMGDEEPHEKSILATTFAASCRYLVEIACFPCWKPLVMVKESDGKCVFTLSMYFVSYSYVLYTSSFDICIS